MSEKNKQELNMDFMNRYQNNTAYSYNMMMYLK